MEIVEDINLINPLLIFKISMISYYSHGINIFSEIVFPEFISTESMIHDVIIRYGKIYNLSDNFSFTNLSQYIKIKYNSEVINLLYKNYEIFSIINNSDIIVNKDINLDKHFLRYLLIGHALPMILYKRGRLVLHANSININDKAVIFLGTSGNGKSTTSFALYNKGYSIISDDILSIKIGNCDSFAYPGFPKIKLWPEVLEKFEKDPQKFPKIHPKTKKRFCSVSDNFTNHPKAIKAIYLIEKCKENKITKMNSFDSILELIKSSYCYIMFNEKDLSDNFKQITHIVNNIPVKKMEIGNSFNFNNIIQMLEQDLFEVN